MQKVMNEVPSFNIAEGLIDEDFLKDLDAGFAEILVDDADANSKEKKAKKSKKTTITTGVGEMQAMYLEMTQSHLKPVIRYIKAIEQGVDNKDICELVHYVVAPLVTKTKQVGLKEETKDLISFQRSLKRVISTSGRKIKDEDREELSLKFQDIEDKFGLEFRGHSAAVVNLLGFYRNLKKRKTVTESDIRRVFSIGVPSLTMLRKISLAELSSLTGLGAEKSSEIRKIARGFNILSYL